MAKVKLKEIVKSKKKKSEFIENPENQKSVIYSFAIGFSLMFIFVSSLFGRANRAEEVFVEVDKEETAINTTAEVYAIPSEEFPSEYYFVASDFPKEINIPATNISGFVQQVGTDKDNKMAYPNNIHMAGWYIHSVKPGEKGLSIMNGHVNGMYNQGIFYDLDLTLEGEEFTVIFGDGIERRFRIIDKVLASEPEANDILFSKRLDIESQLNLITSIETLNGDTETYNRRLIVISEMI